MTHAPPLQLWGICLCRFVSGLELALPMRDRASLQVSVLVFARDRHCLFASQPPGQSRD